jgi:membrane fusion protein (multidrug efflux system)
MKKLKNRILEFFLKNKYINIIISIFIGILLYYVIIYIKYINSYISTNDSYITSHIVSIVSNNHGTIINLPISNNHKINKGDLLLKLSSYNYKNNLQKIKYQLEILNFKLCQSTILKNKLELQIKQAKINELILIEHAQESLYLAKYNFISLNEKRTIIKKLQLIYYDICNLKLELKTINNELNIQLLHIKIQNKILYQIKHELSKNILFSPVNGIICNLFLTKGDNILFGEKLFSIIDTNKWKIEANFKETQIKKIHIGQQAKIILDMYPDIKIYGVVNNISSSSGSSFSLLPIENATGNWIKIVQRFPIDISLDNQYKNLFKIGASAKVIIYTT